MIDGTWESADAWHGIDEGMTAIGAFSDAHPCGRAGLGHGSAGGAEIRRDPHAFTWPCQQAGRLGLAGRGARRRMTVRFWA